MDNIIINDVISISSSKSNTEEEIVYINENVIGNYNKKVIFDNND